MINDEIKKIFSDPEKCKSFSEKVKRILSVDNLEDGLSLANEIFKISGYDKTFDSVENSKPQIPILGRIIGMDEYISHLDTMAKECHLHQCKQPLLNCVLDDDPQGFENLFIKPILNAVDSLQSEKGDVYALCILSTRDITFENGATRIAGILETLYMNIGKFKDQIRETYPHLCEKRDYLRYELENLQHTLILNKEIRAKAENLLKEYIEVSKQFVMLLLLDDFIPYVKGIYYDIEKVYRDLFEYLSDSSAETHTKKFKLRPEGIRLLKELEPLKYQPCYDGIHVYGGSLVRSGFIDFTTGVTLPCEIGRTPVTEFSGTYSAKKLEHIEAHCVKRVNITLQGDADMVCRPPLLYGGMRDTIESMSLTFEAPTMHCSADFKNRTDITYIKFSGIVVDDPDWELSNFRCELFQNCTALTRIDGVFKGHFLSCGTFQNCTSLISAPELHVKIISYSVFKNASSLKTVFIQNGLESMGTSVFEGCSSLEDLYIPDTCSYIGSNTFKNCTSLKTIHLPNCLNEISEGLFYNCESLKKVFLSDNITQIGDNSFYNCKSLEKPWIPQSIKRIGENAFYGCVSIKEITIPKGIEEIGKNAFAGIPSLIIKGYAGTVAELYASENGIPFVALDVDADSPKLDTTYDLSRFTEAHKSTFEIALAEIKNGKKQSHWMWYIFPQIIGLGKRDTSIKYSIKDINEAKLFLKDAYLGENLKKICEALLALNTNDARFVFGDIDARKLKSSMTLFMVADQDNTLFKKVLDKFFGGNPDYRTLSLLKKHQIN